MSPERLRKVEEIYHAVLEISPSGRARFLAESCGEDIELRREVESLLSFEKSFASVIDSPPKSLVTELFVENERSALINQKNKSIPDHFAFRSGRHGSGLPGAGY